jgi:anti-sigma regulatory factor (Ser/Thr protein kinase)
MTDAEQRGRPLLGLSWSARAVLPATDRAPQAARRLVATMLGVWGAGAMVEVAELVASELVSNSVRHAGDGGDIELELSMDERVVRLCVADGSTLAPAIRIEREPGTGGLGLRLVDRVALRWGVDDYLFGKRVWVDLAIGSD